MNPDFDLISEGKRLDAAIGLCENIRNSIRGNSNGRGFAVHPLMVYGNAYSYNYGNERSPVGSLINGVSRTLHTWKEAAAEKANTALSDYVGRVETVHANTAAVLENLDRDSREMQTLVARVTQAVRGAQPLDSLSGPALLKRFTNLQRVSSEAAEALRSLAASYREEHQESYTAQAQKFQDISDAAAAAQVLLSAPVEVRSPALALSPQLQRAARVESSSEDVLQAQLREEIVALESRENNRGPSAVVLPPPPPRRPEPVQVQQERPAMGGDLLTAIQRGRPLRHVEPVDAPAPEEPRLEGQLKAALAGRRGAMDQSVEQDNEDEWSD